VCDDRTNLLDHGIEATDFAYPYGAFDAGVAKIVRECGYDSARATDAAGPDDLSAPPRNRYAIPAEPGTDLTALEKTIAAKERSGGWLVVLFHNVDAGDPSLSIARPELGRFLDWLDRQRSRGVDVETVRQVIGGPVRPAVPGPAIPAAPVATSTLPNASFELDSNHDGTPDCWQLGGYGANDARLVTTSDAHSGARAATVEVSRYQSGDAKLVVQQDLGACAPTVTPGHRYELSTWYKADAPVSFTLYSRDDHWTWRYWQTGPRFPASTSWTRATWVTPPIPDAVNGLSFGLTLTSNGRLTVDDAALVDAAAGGDL
jgi:hypothetical protein